MSGNKDKLLHSPTMPFTYIDAHAGEGIRAKGRRHDIMRPLPRLERRKMGKKGIFLRHFLPAGSFRHFLKQMRMSESKPRVPWAKGQLHVEALLQSNGPLTSKKNDFPEDLSVTHTCSVSRVFLPSPPITLLPVSIGCSCIPYYYCK